MRVHPSCSWKGLLSNIKLNNSRWSLRRHVIEIPPAHFRNLRPSPPSYTVTNHLSSPWFQIIKTAQLKNPNLVRNRRSIAYFTELLLLTVPVTMSDQNPKPWFNFPAIFSSQVIILYFPLSWHFACILKFQSSLVFKNYMDILEYFKKIIEIVGFYEYICIAAWTF